MMKKVVSLLMAMVMIFSLAACGQTKNESTGVNQNSAQNSTKESSQVKNDELSKATEAAKASGKTLIVYFSWSADGNTEKMATYIQKQTGGDILRLEPADPYPADYGETANLAKTERDENTRPEIANMPGSISGYDKIFVGYPIWWHTAPMIIGTFLNNFDFTGVEIYPFTQSASMDKEQFNNSMEFVKENAKGAVVHDGLFVNATDTDGMKEYLTKNGFGY